MPLALPIDFDQPEIFSYALTDFPGANSSITSDPALPPSHQNVASAVFPVGLRQPFAGTIMGGANGLESPIVSNQSSATIAVDVYAPRAGVEVQLKLENAADPFVSSSATLLTNRANEWETMTFTINGLSTEHDFEKLIFFFDVGANFTLSDQTWYWDDIRLIE